MVIRVKLYALLDKYLPDGSIKNEVDLTVTEGMTPTAVIAKLNMPPEICHLVLINGVYVAPSERDNVRLTEGDALAIWPPVAGGR
ncbi:MAG: MoaD/ThiS family protein [Rhodospirillales bacterium]|nr:MoaD/ThiS family protein [Acidimicrobiales bacterium]MED5395226.1 MoaD/ThiS family protein [Pseudomonadota bacterium]